MPDFTSALYLGLLHPSGSLGPWAQLTTGAPAALRRVPYAASVARLAAALQRCQASTLVPSTLHAAWDLGGLLDPRRDQLYVDAGTYPVLRCAEARASARGIRARVFPHHDAVALAREGDREHRIVVLVDGVCPGCGTPAPLADYLRVVRPREGLLVVDDTQAVGILGRRTGGDASWGRGGGGSLAFHRLDGEAHVLVIASFAKAFGVPVAAVSGTFRAVADYEAMADTRLHSSPVSMPGVRALERALAINWAHGDRLRWRLAAVVRRLRNGLARLGISPSGAPFPVLMLPALSTAAAARLQRHLLTTGVRTVVIADGRDSGRLTFLLTARHTFADVDAAAAALARAPQLDLLRDSRAVSALA